ncbi:hypothetical protein C0992_013030, partial [Termitomyces sp. T32_za158]
MSSSSSTATTGSRSPSPSTPEAIDSLDSVAVQSDLDSWYLSAMQQPKPFGAQTSWEMTPSTFLTPRKSEDDPMLRLDELIEQHAYD